MKTKYYILFSLLFISSDGFSGGAKTLLDKGWQLLVVDQDIEAFIKFNEAYQIAQKENNLHEMGTALLNMGICSYSVSYSRGLEYAFQSMDVFKKIESSDPKSATQGRAKCLQLISTIYARQSKYRRSIELSLEALNAFSKQHDSTTYTGIIYYSLGTAYAQLKINDSSEFFHRKALKERILTNDYVYLPGSYIAVGEIESKNGNQEKANEYFRRAYNIADSTRNRQAQVLALLAIGYWYDFVKGQTGEAQKNYNSAILLAKHLNDRSFYIKALKQQLALFTKQGNYKEALHIQQEISEAKDSLNAGEMQHVLRSLEVQFEVSEKERRLTLLQKEKNIIALTNVLLWGSIIGILLITTSIILFQRKVNKKNKELMKMNEEQKKMKEIQMQQELAYKENQMNALAVQMLQKNQLLQELKEGIEQEHGNSNNNVIQKIIHKGLNQEKEWSDFNQYFESINHHFYQRIKSAYPEISPNDLKLCALIKLHLSIKEMAAILAISPESVKTARYRLRKKLQLNTEDNLTEFIINL